MNKTYTISIVLLILFIIPSCSPEKVEVRMNRFYHEGPHIYIKDNKFQVEYYYHENRAWKKDQSTLDSSFPNVNVQTPTGDTIQVLIRESEPETTSIYDHPERLLIVSDIEGNYVGLSALLAGNQVIDQEGNWAFDQGHLIMLGDLFDRGPDVTPSLWLLYKLEQQAHKAGGKVHILLGNHEIMIFQGDIRYIHRKYLNQQKDTNIPYESLYTVNTILGKWLRSKPAIIRLGTSLFTHAGISPELLSYQMGLDEMNQWIRNRNLNPNATAVWQDPKTSMLFGGKGLFWYRDWIENTPSEDQLDKILSFYNASNMVIGHTIVPEPIFYHRSKLLAVDVHQPKQMRNGRFRAVLQEKGVFYEVNDLGIKKEIIIVE